MISDIPQFQKLYQHHDSNINLPMEINFHGMKKSIILVSPTYYFQRKELYEKQNSNSIILPLIFQWSSLNLYQIKKIMALPYLQNQGKLSSSFVEILINSQTQNKLITFNDFITNLRNYSNQSDVDWIEKRINFVKYFIDEFYFDINNDEFKHPFTAINFNDIFQPGNFILCDLTDPIYSQDDTLLIFQLLLK